jgi:hypothetical protein
MKKILITSLLLTINFIVKAQSFEETQQWIANNASAKNYTKVNASSLNSGTCDKAVSKIVLDFF